MFQKTPHYGMDATLFYMERQKALDSVDTRIGEFRDKFNALVDDYNVLVEKLSYAKGFWNKLKLKVKIANILSEIDTVRDLEDSLIELRAKHT